MTSRERNVPRLALWLLRHTRAGKYEEALAGDLVERFREGQTGGWLWRQVFIVCALGILGAIRRRWAFFFYAGFGTVAMCLRPMYEPARISVWLHWSDLPWPLSQFVFELSAPVLVTLAAMFVLAAGLLVDHSFRWAYLLRTWIVSVTLVAIGHYSIDLFPGLLRSIPGKPYHKVLIVPEALLILLLAFSFLVAAWLGYPMAERSEEFSDAL